MNSTPPEVVSGELVPVEHGRTLFATDDPVEVLDHARRMADALKTALDQGGMTMKIGKNEHVLIDGWQTLGSMLGVSPHVVWSRRLVPVGDDQRTSGWEARAEARTVDGRVVGAAEAMVTRAERNWRSADDYALRSMAQTRAMSKALRGPLGFVITLAGRNPTPAEEVPSEAPTAAQAGLPHWAADVPADALDRFEANLAKILTAADVADPAQAATDVANAVVGYCDHLLPAACALLARRLADETTTNPAPGVPDLDADIDAAAAPDHPVEG